jgi:hypothetical protein
VSVQQHGEATPGHLKLQPVKHAARKNLASTLPELGPSVRRTKEQLKLNRNQLQWVTGLPTGHCHVKGHLFKMGLTNSRICERCTEKGKSQRAATANLSGA